MTYLAVYLTAVCICAVFASLFFKGATMNVPQGHWYIINRVSSRSSKTVDGAYALSEDHALRMAYGRNGTRPRQVLTATRTQSTKQELVAAMYLRRRTKQIEEFEELMNVTQVTTKERKHGA